MTPNLPSELGRFQWAFLGASLYPGQFIRVGLFGTVPASDPQDGRRRSNLPAPLLYAPPPPALTSPQRS